MLEIEAAQGGDRKSTYAQHTLINTRTQAAKIHARAIRRCGELMLEIEKAQGANNQHVVRVDDTRTTFTRTQAAKDAGMSVHQRKQALRIASIDQPLFEELVAKKERKILCTQYCTQ